MSIQIKGLERVKLMFDNLRSTLQNKVPNKLREVLEDIRDDAKMNCPEDTGSLKRSIRIEAYANPKGVFTCMGVRAGGYVTNPKTGRLVDYAAHVEYGTHYQRAQPYMRPALESNRAKLEVALVEAALESLRYLF